MSYISLDDNPVLRGMRVPAAESRQWDGLLREMSRYTEQHPDTCILTYGKDALYAALAPNLRNASPFYIYWSNAPVPEGTFESRLRFIETHKPLLFFEGEQLFYDGPRLMKVDDEGKPASYFVKRQEILARNKYRKLLEFKSEKSIYSLYAPESY
jgi:hypothetical protein